MTMRVLITTLIWWLALSTLNMKALLFTDALILLAVCIWTVMMWWTLAINQRVSRSQRWLAKSILIGVVCVAIWLLLELPSAYDFQQGYNARATSGKDM